MKEIYNVKRPNRVVFGDPMYFEEFSGTKLKRLTVNSRPPTHFIAKVVLEETPYEEFPEEMQRTMSLYLAPEKTMETYLRDMKYSEQKENYKGIGVDTAKYLFQVDDNSEIILTGGDGYWGDSLELSCTVNGEETLDAAIINVLMPDHITMEDMRRYLRYFFKDVQPTEVPAALDPEKVSPQIQEETGGSAITQ